MIVLAIYSVILIVAAWPTTVAGVPDCDPDVVPNTGNCRCGGKVCSAGTRCFLGGEMCLCPDPQFEVFPGTEVVAGCDCGLAMANAIFDTGCVAGSFCSISNIGGTIAGMCSDCDADAIVVSSACICGTSACALGNYCAEEEDGVRTCTPCDTMCAVNSFVPTCCTCGQEKCTPGNYCTVEAGQNTGSRRLDSSCVPCDDVDPCSDDAVVPDSGTCGCTCGTNACAPGSYCSHNEQNGHMCFPQCPSDAAATELCQCGGGPQQKTCATGSRCVLSSDGPKCACPTGFDAEEQNGSDSGSRRLDNAFDGGTHQIQDSPEYGQSDDNSAIGLQGCECGFYDRESAFDEEPCYARSWCVLSGEGSDWSGQCIHHYSNSHPNYTAFCADMPGDALDLTGDGIINVRQVK